MDIGWGLVAAILGMLSCVLVLIGVIVPFGTEQVLIAVPMLPQEMVLAAWLIAKGFNPAVIASKSPQVDS